MKIVVGLGNPGEKYKKSRHNVGFFALDHFANYLEESQNLEVQWKNDDKHNASIAKTQYDKNSILLVKPLTMMNLSGQAIRSIIGFYKESPEDVIVIYDDIDLPLGEVRMRRSGSAGTHNGMKSIITELQTGNFPRIRIGIENRPPELKAKIDLADYVLSNFADNEQEKVRSSLEKTLLELQNLLT